MHMVQTSFAQLASKIYRGVTEPTGRCPAIIRLSSEIVQNHPNSSESPDFGPDVLPLLISNFIKVFNASLQCEFIRTFYENTYYLTVGYLT